MDEQEFINRFGMTREEYGKKFGTLQDPNMGKGATLRQKAVDKVAGVLQSIGYGDQYSSYDAARGLLGSYENPMSEGGIGVLDFTPIQIPFAIQEAKRAYDRGDYLESALGAGFAAIETAPGIKLATTPVKNFFKSLSRKSSPVDPSRRSAMTTIAAAPLAVGALSEVPVGKIIEDVMPVSDIPAAKPVAKKIAGAIVKNVGQPSKTQTIGELMQMSDFAYDFTHPLSISPVGEVVGLGAKKQIKLPSTLRILSESGRLSKAMASEIQTFSEKLNKAKKYFEMKNKAETADELDMLSPNGRIADHLESLQKEFGYTNDQIINFIDETDSVTRKNATAWEKYLEGGIEGDPDVGKELGLGDESGEGWFEDDLWEKFYGSNEADIAGNTIAKAEK